MCGIIGYIGDKNAVPILIEGLKKLEYRGYDSCGICVVKNGKLVILKERGKISELEEKKELRNMKGNIGIGHTRWATHGQPSKTNAHPHLDCKREIAIVHNGIIENYQSLKKMLEGEGHKIISETDSEIIVHLIEKFYSQDLREAVVKAIKLVEGAFGLVIICKNEEKLIAARKGSPLVIGIGKNGMFIASDVPAILKYTRKVIYLKDNEVAEIEKNSYLVKKLDGKEIDKKIHRIKWSINQIEKGNFKHFTLKEIFEQPEAIKNTLRGRLKNGKIKLSLKLDINSIKRIIITACGTSWHAGLIGKCLIEKITRIPVEVDYASEFRYRNPIINGNDLVIVISQSGETADTLAALQEAKFKRAKTLGIVNVVGSTISREVDSGIYLHSGPEIGVASTKAFTSQIVALLLFALFLNQERNIKLDKEILKELEFLPLKIKRILKKSDEVREIAEKFKDSENFLYLGRGINFPVALEGALKLKELSYVSAQGYPAGEMKHGPIALVDKNITVIFVAPKDRTFKKILNNMEEVKTRKGKIIAVTDKKDEKLNKLTDALIRVPRTKEEISPILNVIPLQLFAYYVADLKKIDVDKPRNLAKSVTVE
ncbi:glutamine--fructose-6-phosphate transaminase (isomerizing) [bacterium]|nr:glutamine--fructose-6-phosphate transaminase (isomerizing) [bacterium]